jgi:hypothetical protein
VTASLLNPFQTLDFSIPYFTDCDNMSESFIIDTCIAKGKSTAGKWLQNCLSEGYDFL